MRKSVINLDRFVKAQENSYEEALSEIKDGKKRSHWMWYIFPQYKGLGFSDTSKYYAIGSKEEAAEFLEHPILGQRLKEISQELLHLGQNDAKAIFGSPDYLKLKSSMTLFSEVAQQDDNIFKRVLDKFYNGERDEKTLKLLEE